MAHLLHIDSSVQGDLSVSRRLTARAAERWRATHPGGTVTYRDFAVDPIPHLDGATGTARLVQSDQRTPAQDESFARSDPSTSSNGASPTKSPPRNARSGP